MKTAPSAMLSDRPRQAFISELWSLWMSQPRRLLLGRVLFQVHLYCGPTIGLALTVIGLSGSALVFKD
jgi:hypothetical protein